MAARSEVTAKERIVIAGVCGLKIDSAGYISVLRGLRERLWMDLGNVSEASVV